jgi:hypothetical protein
VLTQVVEEFVVPEGIRVQRHPGRAQVVNCLVEHEAYPRLVAKHVPYQHEQVQPHANTWAVLAQGEYVRTPLAQHEVGVGDPALRDQGGRQTTHLGF